MELCAQPSVQTVCVPGRALRSIHQRFFSLFFHIFSGVVLLAGGAVRLSCFRRYRHRAVTTAAAERLPAL
ncbi:hypothetical protein CPB86DRAFT_124700 [Serendipita vermifera]|nr:hypothetical protein CPB86DRAFT_124700 [Serendipita vermifera]